jgi:Zn-finger domain-containing protein
MNGYKAFGLPIFKMEMSEVEKIVKKFPNDMDLGRELRHAFYRHYRQELIQAERKLRIRKIKTLIQGSDEPQGES